MKLATIVLCAGSSVRMKSAHSKILHPLCGKPVGYWSIKNALNISDVPPIVVLGKQKEEIKQELEKYFPAALNYVIQEDPDGTGGAVKRAVAHLNDKCSSVLVMCGDTPLLTNESLNSLVTIQKKIHVPIAIMTAIAPDPTGYGRIIRGNDEQVCAIVEEAQATLIEKEIKEINPSVYVFDTEYLKENIEKLDNNNTKKEYQLTDIIKLYIKNGPKLGPVQSLEVPYEEVHGVNDRKQLAIAQKVMNLRLLEKWMKEGVSFIDPSCTYIEKSVVLSSDVTIYPQVHLTGRTKIGENSIIHSGCIINDGVIGSNVTIWPYSVCSEVTIGNFCQVGPFARLRPQTKILTKAKVGNFVETKNTTLGENSKANHLAYLGDCDIANNCNIGAGSIICNFDGENKYHTSIDEGAFIGSNATLIAPVKVGENSYVSAGSVIEKDVPSNNIAFGRSRQENKSLHKK